MLGVHRITPGVRVLLILVAMGWIVTSQAPHMGGEWLSLDPARVMGFEAWRLITYPFAATLSVWTVIMLVFFVGFASAVEEMLGTTRFYRLVFGAAVVAGLMTVLTSAVSGLAFALGGLSVPFVTLIAAFCFLHWDNTQPIIHFYLILPVTSRFMLAIEVLLILATFPAPYWPAMLSPIAVAYLMVRRNWLMHSRWFARSKQSTRKTRLSGDFSGAKVTPLRPAFQAAPVSPLEAEVDRILDKLRSEGMASLTEEERAVLDAQSQRLRKSDER